MHHIPHDLTLKVVSGAGIWEILTATGTILAVVVAVFQETFWKYWRRPILKVVFDANLERCFRFAVIPLDNIQEQPTFQNVWRQYFRLQIVNTGLSAVSHLKAKVELFDAITGDLADRFEPSLLRWIVGGSSVDLAAGEEDYLNLVSEVINPKSGDYLTRNSSSNVVINPIIDINYRMRLELANMSERGIAWDRHLQEWKLQVTFYGDNLVKPVIKFFKYVPSENGEPGNLFEISN